MRIYFTVSMSNLFSVQHIRSAAIFSRLADKMEQECRDNLSEVAEYEHKACVTGAIFTATSFLESTINEVFWETSESAGEPGKNLPSEVKKVMSEMWKHKIPKTASYPILKKYQIALVLAGKPQFDTGRRPYQDIDALVQLRNALIHFEPEWVSSDQPQNIEKQLQGKFELNPLVPEGCAFFPHRCLSHSCAEWAVKSSLKFTDDFFARIGITPKYENFRSMLNPKWDSRAGLEHYLTTAETTI